MFPFICVNLLTFNHLVRSLLRIYYFSHTSPDALNNTETNAVIRLKKSKDAINNITLIALQKQKKSVTLAPNMEKLSVIKLDL